MAIYVFTGKLGSGKTLCAVGRIKDYLEKNRKVATNIDLDLSNMLGFKSKKCRVFRIPDRPIINDLEAIGLGYEGDYSGEENNGLIVLDECAQFLNTRNFQDKERKKITEWFVHARKKRWDVIFVIQHLNALDKQFRDMFAEHIVYCNRMDRLRVPFGFRHIVQLMGFSGNLPKIHRALVMYGTGPNAIKVDSWIYTGKSLYSSFATEQGFKSENEGGIYQLIPPWYLNRGNDSDFRFFKRKVQEFFTNSSVKTRHFFSLGLLTGIVGFSVAGNKTFDNPVVLQPAVNELIDVDPVAIKPVSPFDDHHWYITGSLIGSKSELNFEVDGRPVYPHDEGYRYLIKSKCHALLMKDGFSTDVYCGAARARQRAPEPQYASALAVDKKSIPAVEEKKKPL